LEHPQVSAQDRRAALLRNIHGWCGVLPIALFLSLHVTTSALLLLDTSWFIGVKRWKAAAPALAWIEIALVWLPLSLHAVYGAWLTVSGRTAREARPETATLLIRVSGFASLAFIAYHALDFRFAYPGAEPDAADTAQKLYAELSATTASGIPLSGALYLLGLGVSVCHGAYATYWMYAASRAEAERSRIARSVGCGAALLFLMGAQTIVFCATGSRFFFW
jgi:succinate dehydrogenase / fumarate reductase cytochrome b subunit